MNENPVVTIVCMCYNHEKYVIEALNSVLNQSYSTIQLIIADDCSDDNSVAVIENWLKDYPSILFIKNKINLGNTTTFNSLLKYVKGDYIIDLAADDILLPDCIEIQFKTFKNSTFKNLAIVYGNAELITEEGDHFSYYFNVDESLKTNPKRPSGAIYNKVISFETTICSVSAMYSKAVFDKLNGYDTTLSYEDFDYWIRASRDYNIEFIDKIIMQKRIVPNSLQTTFYTKHNKNSFSTFIILRKAFKLNKNKYEHRILTKRVNHEILNSYRTSNYFLMLKNMYLRFLIGLNSI